MSGRSLEKTIFPFVTLVRVLVDAEAAPMAMIADNATTTVATLPTIHKEFHPSHWGSTGKIP